MKFKSFILSVLLALISIPMLSQSNSAYVEGDLLVQLLEHQTIDDVLEDFALLNQSPTQLKLEKVLSPSLGIYQLNFDHQSIATQALMDAIFHHPSIKHVQLNHLVSYRETTPNDTGFEDQWQYVNISGRVHYNHQP